MGPEPEFGEMVIRAYTLTGGLDDLVSRILRNVRVPTAQMDIFSVILQICADHLISNASDQAAKDAFTEMVKSCGFFTGAGHRLEFLKSEPAISCYRSMYWYSRTENTQERA
jgi:hypothetical protein